MLRLLYFTVIFAFLVTFSLPGNSTTPPPDQAFLQLWQPKADLGDAEAQDNVGYYYLRNRNFPEALKWYRKAAEQGEAEAQRRLGQMYGGGEGVAKDDDEATKWYLKAAVQGDINAQWAYLSLAAAYATGRGIKQDWAEAYFWYSLNVATPLNQGFIQQGLAASEVKMRDDAAKYLTPEQKTAVDKRIAEWNPPPSPSYIKMTEKLKNKAAQGDWSGYSGLGANAEKGFGIKPNFEEAAKWYKLGAERGNQAAQFKLGSFYLNGQGVKQDYEQAYFWLLLSSIDAKKYSINANLEPRDEAARRLTGEQISAVQDRVKDWKPLTVPAVLGSP